MNQRFLTFLLSALVTASVFCQTDVFVEPIPLDSVRAYEKELNSTSKGFHYFNPYYKDDFQDLYKEWPRIIQKPLIFKRTNDEFYPTLHVWYYVDKDSTVKWLKYNWGFANTKVEVTNEEIRAQTLRLENFKTKYAKEKEYLSKILGQPTESEQKKETETYINQKTIWNKDTYKLVLEMTVDKKALEFTPENSKHRIVFPRSGIEINIMMKEKETKK